MSEPKPLTKEEREAFELEPHVSPSEQEPLFCRWNDEHRAAGRCYIGNCIWRQREALLAAEAFWREAVKNLDPFPDNSFGEYAVSCVFCDVNGFAADPVHKPDCPWKLAQE